MDKKFTCYIKLLGKHYHCSFFFNGKLGGLIIPEEDFYNFKSQFPNFDFRTEQ